MNKRAVFFCLLFQSFLIAPVWSGACDGLNKNSNPKKLHKCLQGIDCKLNNLICGSGENEEKPFDPMDMEVIFKVHGAGDCKTEKVYLGSREDYLLWSLSGQNVYRHGCNKGGVSCSVELEGDLWVLSAKGATHNCGSGCGASQITCTAMGLKLPNKDN